MVEVEESSILKSSPSWFMPEYQPSKRRVVWPNGAVATMYSGDEPDQLRGPQHDTVWMDEIAKFRYPQETWDNMELGLRMGDNPQVAVTSTPRPIKIIKNLIADSATVDVTGSSYENMDNLAPRFIERVIKKYEGTRIGKQELYGELLDDDPKALWNRDLLDSTRVVEYPDLHKVVVAIDPAASSGQTGIVVVGIAKVGDDVHGYVLDDVSTPEGSKPERWAAAAISAYNKWSASYIVAEINNGGDMIENVIRNVQGGKYIPYKVVRATKGKYTRAEPVSTMFEQGRAHMVGYYSDLEDQLCQWVPGNDSPDRLDAMVWAFTAMEMVHVPSALPKQPQEPSRFRLPGDKPITGGRWRIK